MRYIKLSLAVIGLTACIGSCSEETNEGVKVLVPERIAVSSPDQILPLEDSLVRPVLYLNVPNLENLPVEQSKEKFVAAVLPAILIARYRLNQNLQRVQSLVHKEAWEPGDSIFYESLATRYKANDPQTLIRRLTCHPNSIILAQAAVESGWGQSRFFEKGNNLFGIWSYSRMEPRMVASLTRGGEEVYLRKYEDISESIMDYFETVGRSRAYRYFRMAREKTEDPFALLPHLKYYSERREEYVEQLRTIIVQNDFTRYDHYMLDPQYFKEFEY